MDKRIVLGIMFILIGLTPILTFLSTSTLTPNYFFWFSNHTFLVMGIALLFASPFWIFAELCIGAFPETVWSIDFLFQLITHKPLFGITTYMFNGTGLNWIHIYSVQHILFLPCALYALHILGGPVKNAWMGSVVHQLALWAAGLLHSTELNINCAYHTCGVPLPWHMATWPVLMLVNVALAYTLTWFGWRKLKLNGDRSTSRPAS